jgi:hypothetical protein
MVWPYSVVINHHLPAAAALLASLYLLKTQSNPRGWLLAGISAGLAVSFDVVSAFLCVSLAAISLRRDWRGIVYFGSGALVPLVITGVLDYQISGTVYPPYLIKGAYVFPGSRFPDAPGGMVPPANVLQAGFNMLIGSHGLYAYAPVLLFALSGLVMTILTKTHAFRWEAMCIGLGYVALTTYLITGTYNFAGVAYGERYFLHAMPLVMMFVVFVSPMAPSRWRLAAGALFAVVLTISVLSNYQGVRDPWKDTPPLVQLTRDPVTGAIGIK